MKKQEWDEVKKKLQPGIEYMVIYTRKMWQKLHEEGKLKDPYRMTIRQYIGEDLRIRGKIIFSHNFLINYRQLVIVKKINLNKKNGK